MEETTWHEETKNNSFLNSSRPAVGTPQAQVKESPLPLIIFNGPDIEDLKSMKSQDGADSNLNHWDGSSRATTPLLSDACLSDDDSSTRSLDGLEDDFEDSLERDELAECSLNHEVNFAPSWGDDRMQVTDTESQYTKQSQPFEVETEDQARRPVALKTFEDTTCSQNATIQDLLFKALEFSDHPERKRFIPKTTLTEIVNEKTIQKDLQQHAPSLSLVTSEALARRICGARSFRNIFALLALVGRSTDIERFLNEDVADDDLPLHKTSRPGSMAFRLGRCSSSGDTVQPLKCFDGWNNNVLWMFEDWQWATLAPTFHGGERKDVRHLDLGGRTPLPFTSDSRYGTNSQTIRGGFSTVFKVDIHPGHHTFRGFEDGDGRSFAVKCLSSMDEAQFEQEVDMLRKFNDNAHPHLISLLATYKQSNKFYLIFPWADADLQSYWRDVNFRPSMDHDTVRWMGQQCLGIAKGLLEIHRHDTMPLKNCQGAAGCANQPIRLFGRHGDIKSNNILWFRNSAAGPTDRGVLKITDFGLGEFQKSASTIYKSPSKVAVSASYRSPECDIRGGQVGQSHDVWALGCLYLELVAWILGGWNLVERFQKIREAKNSGEYYANATDGTFFKIATRRNGEPVAMIKPVVAEFIDSLHRHQKCTKYLHQFLDLIQNDMLVVKSKNPQDTSRIDMSALTWRLKELYQACEDTDFALERVPGAFNK